MIHIVVTSKMKQSYVNNLSLPLGVPAPSSGVTNVTRLTSVSLHSTNVDTHLEKPWWKGWPHHSRVTGGGADIPRQGLCPEVPQLTSQRLTSLEVGLCVRHQRWARNAWEAINVPLSGLLVAVEETSPASTLMKRSDIIRPEGKGWASMAKAASKRAQWTS